ncbi:MAG: signal peptidase I [Firmicutes bacterium]|nr:signal peptidase I [Bacillota bacterium]
MLKEVWEWVRAIIIAVVVALLFRMFVLEHFLVEGESMIPTLNNSERIIVNKMVYHFSNPEQGDIVVFNYQGRRDFIKRAVGVEGDTIQIINNRLYRNGLAVNESYLENGTMQDYGPVTVPPEHIFVLGDNRPNSRDSRYPDVGFVSLEKVKGRAGIVFWPLEHIRRIN